MRFIILAVATLILLGIVGFSVYSGSSNDNIQDDKNIIPKTEVNNSSFFEVSLSETNENDIFEEIKLDNSSIKAPESCNEFETIIVNPSKFRELASNGTLNLSLMGEDYELKLQEEETRKLNVTSYSGYIVEKPQSSAFFTVKNNSINGCINVDFYTLSYGIASTEESHDGKIVHILWKYYNEGAEEELKKHYSLDPLEFSLTNSDKKTHEVYIELFDFYNQSVFKNTYTLNPGDQVFSPKINVEPGIYRYEIFQDNELIGEETVRADYAAELGSSEKLHINLIDHPEYPMEIGIEVA